MTGGPKVALPLLRKYIAIDSPPRTVREWLTDISIGEGWHSDESSAQEAAERWGEQLLQLVREELTTLQELGRDCVYVLNSSSPYMIQGAAHIAPADGPDVRAAKERRAQRELYAAALASLSPRNFEILCVGVLALLGVEEPVFVSVALCLQSPGV